MEDKEPKKSSGTGLLATLVVDSGAIIRGHGTNFHRKAEKFVTVQEVLAEIRDSKSRDLLASLPYELEIRSPSDESMAAVASFSKKSGDFAALSLTDIKLIALTYTIEKEVTGGLGIRIEPIRHIRSLQQQTKKKKGGAVESLEVFAGGVEFDGVIRSLTQACDCANGGAEGHVHAGTENAKEAQHETSTHEHGKCLSSEESDNKSGDESEDQSDLDDEDDVATARTVDVEEEDQEEEENVSSTVHKKGVSFASDACKITSIEPIVPLLDEDFPALGGLSLSANDAAAPTTTTAFSWATVAKSGNNDLFNIKPKKKPENRPSIPQFVKSESAATTDGANGRTTAWTSDSHDANAMPSRILSGNTTGHSALASARAALEDDGEGWINESNFKSSSLNIGDSFRSEKDILKKKNIAKAEEDIRVACITTDFSMQNVMMQMGLNIVSVDGMLVRSVKQWVLRCMACYRVHYQMDRLFCEQCGANHLSRVSCSIDADSGELKLHLKKNYVPNTRGKIYSLPKPGKQGRYDGELLLREDQLLTGVWLQKKMAVQRNLKSAFGEDVTGDVGLHVNKGIRIKVGLGKQNPNAAKGRERRGKSKR